MNFNWEKFRFAEILSGTRVDFVYFYFDLDQSGVTTGNKRALFKILDQSGPMIEKEARAFLSRI